jgi:hypothetical protein
MHHTTWTTPYLESYSRDAMMSLLSQGLDDAHHVRALFLPSFNPEGLLSVRDDAGPQLVLTRCEPSMWVTRAEFQALPPPQNRLQARLRKTPTVEVHRTRVPVDTDLGTLFALAHDARHVTRDMGLDGTQVRIEAWNGTDRVCADAWSPEDDSPARPVLAALYALARGVFTDGPEQAFLDTIHRSVQRTPPLQWCDDGRRLRLFSGFSSLDDTSLLAALADVPEGGVLDIRNLSPMAGLLYDDLRAWCTRRPDVRWWYRASFLLDAVGVPEGQRVAR